MIWEATLCFTSLFCVSPVGGLNGGLNVATYVISFLSSVDNSRAVDWVQVVQIRYRSRNPLEALEGLYDISRSITLHIPQFHNGSFNSVLRWPLPRYIFLSTPLSQHCPGTAGPESSIEYETCPMSGYWFHPCIKRSIMYDHLTSCYTVQISFSSTRMANYVEHVTLSSESGSIVKMNWALEVNFASPP
jgi:hypothetical protein